MTIQCAECIAGAGPGDALAGLDQKQRTMGGALDEAGTGIEKLVGLPLQGNPSMGAAIAIDEDLPTATGREDFQAIDIEPAALRLGKLGGVTKPMHFRLPKQTAHKLDRQAITFPQATFYGQFSVGSFLWSKKDPAKLPGQ